MSPPPAVHHVAALALLVALCPRYRIGAQTPETAFGGVRQVTRSENYDPSFSPDGGSIVYISAVAGREQLFVRSLDGRSVRQLTTDTADHEDLAWSPEGDTIAFVTLMGKQARIALMPARGGPMEILTPPGERVIHPSRSPDAPARPIAPMTTSRRRRRTPP